jgi:SpoVK/Ycf46/Vps4 family AAA+-type ATPase
MDRAVQRPGRFDFKLQILPPSYEEKLRMARDALGEETYGLVETDLRRQPYRESIRLASRSEMLALFDEFRRRPHDAEHALSDFRAELLDDDTFRDEEAQGSVA